MPELTVEQLDAGRAKAIAYRKKLSELRRRQVSEMKELGMKNADIARELGCSPQNVWNILNSMKSDNA